MTTTPLKPRQPLIPVALRLQPALLERIDALLHQLQRKHPSVNYTRSHAIRLTIARGLDAITKEST
jgi:hypothetical protein